LNEKYTNPIYGGGRQPKYEQDYTGVGAPMNVQQQENTVNMLNQIVLDARSKINDPNVSDVEKNRLSEYIQQLNAELANL
jgi:hypothetical protein